MSFIRPNNIPSLEKCIYSYVHTCLRVITCIHMYVYTYVYDSYYRAYGSYN